MARYLPRELIGDTFWLRLPPPARTVIVFLSVIAPLLISGLAAFLPQVAG